MADKDYYKLLGVNKSSTKEDVKKAYKKLAMQYHPDRAPEEKKKEYEEKFKEISEAAAVLSDDKKRQQYDQFGSAAFSGGMGGGGSSGMRGGAGGFSGFEGFDFSDIMSQFRSASDFDDVFEQVFGGREGGGRGRSRARRGADLLYEDEITLEEAAKGTTKTIHLNKLERCEECGGKGAKHFATCEHCHGSGYTKVTRRTPFGIFQQTSGCGQCEGRGEVPQDSCKHCHGEGLIRRKKEIEVSIPSGVDDGMRLRVRGEGEVGENHGPAGDLFVQVHIAKHEFFQRHGNDLYLTVPISFTQAVLGDEIEVPTIDGKAILTIPAGTDSETMFRMAGKGMPHLHNAGYGSASAYGRAAHGDQLVKVHIEVPKKLGKKQLETLKQLKEEKVSAGFLKRFWG